MLISFYFFLIIIKGCFKLEDNEDFFRCQNKYFTSLSWAETVLGEKFKFSAQDSDLGYLFWQWKNSPVSSDFKETFSQ